VHISHCTRVVAHNLPCVSLIKLCAVHLLTGVDLQTAGGAAEQQAGAVVSDVRVGRDRLRVGRPGAEAHLGHQGPRAGAVLGNGRAAGVRQEELLCGLKGKRLKDDR